MLDRDYSLLPAAAPRLHLCGSGTRARGPFKTEQLFAATLTGIVPRCLPVLDEQDSRAIARMRIATGAPLPANDLRHFQVGDERRQTWIHHAPVFLYRYRCR